MASISKLPFLNDKIINIIKRENEKADMIWKFQDIDYKYKDEWVNSNVKIYCCYYLVNEWFNTDNEAMYDYNEELYQILTACKQDYFGINGIREFPLVLYEPKRLLKHYIYKKCEELGNKKNNTH